MKKLTSLLIVWCLTVISGTARAFSEDMGVITCGETESDEIAAPAEQDTWTFSGQAGERVLIDAERTSGSLDPRIELYPPGGGGSVASDDQFVSCKLPQSGTYTIRVTDHGADHTGSYNISMYNLQGCVWPTITCGETIKAAIDVPSEMDIYQFEGQAGERVLIDAERTSGSLAPRIVLYPPGGGDDVVVGDGFVSYKLAQSGTYTIRLTDVGVDQTGSYSITLKCEGVVGVDLVVSSLDVSPNPVRKPQSATINWTIRNAGGSPATPTGYLVAVRLSDDPVYDESDPLICTTSIDPVLDAGEVSDTYTCTLNTADLSPGDYYVVAMVDTENIVDESSETNNTKTSPVVTIRLCGQPPAVRTLPAEDIKATCATLVGELVSDGGEACECRFRYWPDGGQARYTPWQPGKHTGDIFRATICGLTPATTYSYVAEVRNSAGSGTDDVMRFTTCARLVILPCEPNEGGRVVEPEEPEVELCVYGNVHVLAEANSGFVFWRWEGTGVDRNKVIDPSNPDTMVLVDDNDDLWAAFLPVRCSPDDLDPAPCRGSERSTSQQWDFGDGASAAPPDLYEIDAVPCGGRAPLPGTQVKPLASALAQENQWWAADELWSSDRKGLLALPALQCLLYVWPSLDTTTTVRVQCVWHAYDDAESGSAGGQPVLILEDLNPASLVQETPLGQGWCHSTYVWTVSPSPKVTSFLLRGRIVVDMLIIDTCTE
jgi:hypothetical protein